MDDVRWKVAKRIFAKALAMPPDRRTGWIESECDDEGLRLELMELLDAHGDAGPERGADSPAVPPVEGPGVQIDRYKLLQQIGEGGFGIVYMAAQTEPVERRVALKIIKPGMDSGQVLARFEAERQALAMMDHPNIAKVLDAGTTDSGRPYFVMELVKGISITEYCEQHKLGPKQRLELFIRVCHGVQHAHQKGIIHRDLKPSNVLIAEYDHTVVPKIIDFGVAKAMNQRLTAKTVFTEFGQLVGTFQYMSPEQAKLNQLDIDTRSDVYSLGVLLYELLTGTTPINRDQLRSEAFDELLRLIREEEPAKPSTCVSTMATAKAWGPGSTNGGPKKLSRLLRGDLDWIVMRALDKERNRRYESAGSFADDIERHLQGEVVKAGPPTVIYKLRKFVHRHRGSVLASCALILMLILGLAGTSLGLLQAKVAEADAVAAREAERHMTFRMSVDRGLSLCEQGSVGHGMLWLARALEKSPPGVTAMQNVIRANLNAWRTELNSIEMIYPHDGTVICVAFDPTGRVLATGSGDDTAQLWNVQTGERIRGPMKHGGDVHDIVFSGDGSRLLTAAMDSTAFLWNVHTGEQIRDLGGDDRLRPLSGGALAGAFRHPDDMQIVTGYGDGTITIWDAASGKAIGKLPPAQNQIHDTTVSADGSRLLTSCHDGTVRLWEIDSGELLATFDHGAHERVSAACFFGPDEDQVVSTGGDGNVYIWTVARALAKEDRTLEAAAGEFAAGPWRHSGNVHRLRVSPDRTKVVTASFDSTARIITPGERPDTMWFEHHAGVHGAAFHPDGIRIATSSDDSMARLWQPAPAARVKRTTFPLGLQEAVYNAGGEYLLTKPDENTVVVRETATGTVLCRLAYEGAIRAFAVSPDRSRLLTGSADSVTRIWDVNTRTLLHAFQRQGAGIWTVALNPGGDRAYVGDFDGSIEVRDVRTGELVDEFMLGPRVQGVRFSRDGSRVAVASDDKRARIFRVGSWADPLVLVGHSSPVSTVAFSPDGTRVLTGAFDNTARVWDAATGDPITDPLRVGGPIFFVGAGFSPDGRTVVTGCNDGTARLWDVATSKPIGPALRHDASVHVAAFTAGGQVMTGTSKATVGFWDIPTAPLVDDVGRITLWVQVATGFELDSEGALVALDAEIWKVRRARLDVLGGPPARR